MVIIPHIISLR